MRPPRTWSLAIGLLSVALAACGPAPSADDDDDGADGGGGDRCIGDVTRCRGNQFQICEGGVFVDDQACPVTCSPDLGCVACDPAAGTACDGGNVVTCNPDGTLGEVVESCGSGEACQGGECARDCTADGIDLIYVVDVQKELLSFDPRKLGTTEDPFTLIGTLDCPAGNPVPGWIGPVAPFSMSVDRDRTAWVLYTSGEIFHVDITTAACSTTSFQRLQMGGAWKVFGMGFVTDEAGGSTEKLYVGGGSPLVNAGGLFGYVDGASLAIQHLGNLPDDGENAPDLTGLGSGELFGFYPGSTEAFVQQIDKTTGAALGDKLSIPNGLGGSVQAWAFAQWGGTFYIFVTTSGFPTGNSTVRTIDRATGAYATVLDHLPYKIVGAGVSTCAPVDVD